MIKKSKTQHQTKAVKDQNHKVAGHKSKGEEGSKDNKREKYFSLPEEEQKRLRS